MNIESIIKKAVDEGIKAGDRKSRDIDKLIKNAIKEACEAGRKEADRKPKNIYKATEKLLYALPDLKLKVVEDKEYLESLHGLPQRSKDLVRFKKAGVRLSDEEIVEGMRQDVKARIAANEFEIDRIEKALEPLTSDAYYSVISGRYFEQMTDVEIAEKIPCDPSTVRRNRGRLMHRLSVRLFGAEAL